MPVAPIDRRRWNAGRVALEVTLNHRGIAASHSRPYHPQTCGNVERFHKTEKRWLATQPAQLIATGRQLCAEPDRVAELAAVDLPKHVLSGERDDTWPIPVLDDMAVRLRAHRTVVRGAEHSPNTDQPQATADALIGFWDRLGR